MAGNRGTGAPPPMLDEPGGVPIHVAPSENGTDRAYIPYRSAPTGWLFGSKPLKR